METSTTTSKIIPAFVSASAELSNPMLNKTNPFYNNKYTTLDELINHIRPVLAKHRLAISTPAITTENGAGVQVILFYGEEEQCDEYIIFDSIILPVDKRNAQSVGSTITYAKRYAICSVFSIAGEEDDDGNSASQQSKSNKGNKKTETISEKQASEIVSILINKGYNEDWINRQYEKKFNCPLRELPTENYQEAITIAEKTISKEELQKQIEEKKLKKERAEQAVAQINQDQEYIKRASDMVG